MKYLVEAVPAAAIYYITVMLLDQKLSLGLPRRGRWVISPLIVLTGLAIPVFWCAAGWRGLGSLTASGEILLLILLWGLAVLTITDRARKLIPNRFLLLLLLLWAAVVFFTILSDPHTGMETLLRSAAGALISGAIFSLCYLLSGKRLGAGDVKLSFVMGLYLGGEQILAALLYGLLLSCAASILLLLTKKITRKDGIPLAPFLYTGVLLTLLRIG